MTGFGGRRIFGTCKLCMTVFNLWQMLISIYISKTQTKIIQNKME